jgi:YggT family protein
MQLRIATIRDHRCMNVFVFIVYAVLQVLIYGLIAYAILSWLIAFNVINTHNQFVRSVEGALRGIYEPLLRPIRRILPSLGGVDLSPLVLGIALVAVQGLVTGQFRLF